MTYIMEGYGFNVGNDFARADRDLPIEIAGSDARTVYGYIAGNPQSTLHFLRAPRILVRVDRRCIARSIPLTATQDGAGSAITPTTRK